MLAAALAALLQAAAPPAAKGELVANLQWSLGRPVDAEWQPLDLELQSAGARDLDVRIEIWEEFSRTRLVRRETVPAGGRRRLFLHLPTGRHGGMAFSMRPELRVTGPDGRELASFTLTASHLAWARDEILVGLVTAEAAREGAFGLGWKASGASVEVARLSADRLPDRWVGLAPLRLLLLHDAPLDLLSPEQGAALRDYVRQGGTLLLSPGTARSGFSHPAIAAIADIQEGPAETRTELPSLKPRYPGFEKPAPFRFVPVRNGTPLPGLEDSGIRRFEAGFGQLIVLPFDLSKAPFDGWTYTPRLMTDLIQNAPRADLAWSSETGLPPELGHALRRESALGRMLSLINPYPSWPLLALLTLLYLAAVGPLNYLLLRRLRMTLLLVLSVPAVSLLFLGLTFALAYLTKGSTTTLSSLRVLATRPGLPCAREISLGAVFSPSTREYDVEPPPGRAALPVDRAGADPAERRTRPAPVLLEDGRAPAFRKVSIGQWQSWAFETRALAELGDGLSWELAGGRLKVRNGSALAVERAILVRAGRGGWASPVGALPAGGEVEVPLDAARWSPMEDLGFEDGSLGAGVLGAPLGQLRMLFAREDVVRPLARQEEILVCRLADAGPAAGVDARLSGDSRSVSVLFVRKERP